MVDTYMRPLVVRRGDDAYLRGSRLIKTFGIDVAFEDHCGEIKWHFNMIEVHGDERTRDLLLQRLQA